MGLAVSLRLRSMLSNERGNAVGWCGLLSWV